MSGSTHSNQDELKMYGDLAEWWPLLSTRADYAEEADFFHKIFIETSSSPPKTLLELGSGGGNNASYLKEHYHLTLVEPAAGMRDVSRRLNPECEHLAGDMRTVRLERLFDLVFIHDAIVYMTTETDLRQALETAAIHCRPGGVALFAPDYVRENFTPSTEHGGHDGPERALRYMEWTYDPDETDTIYTVDYTYLLREGKDTVQVAYDRHIEGLFPRAVWLRLLAKVGFEAKVVVDSYERELFIGVKANV